MQALKHLHMLVLCCFIEDIGPGMSSLAELAMARKIKPLQQSTEQACSHCPSHYCEMPQPSSYTQTKHIHRYKTGQHCCEQAAVKL